MISEDEEIEIPKLNQNDLIGNFFTYLEETLKNVHQDAFPNDQTNVSIKINAGKEIEEGISFSSYNIDQEKYNTIIPQNYHNDSNMISVLSFKVISNEAAYNFHNFYLTIKPYINKGLKNETNIRLQDTTIFIDIPHTKNTTFNKLLKTGFNSSLYQKLMIAFSTQFTIKDILSSNWEELLLKLAHFKFVIMQEFKSIFNLVSAVITFAKQNTIDTTTSTLVEIFRVLLIFFTIEMEIELSPKELIDIFNETPEIKAIIDEKKSLLWKDDFRVYLKELKQLIIEYEIKDIIEMIDFEDIELYFVFPFYKIGSCLKLKVAGVNEFINEHLLN